MAEVSASLVRLFSQLAEAFVVHQPNPEPNYGGLLFCPDMQAHSRAPFVGPLLGPSLCTYRLANQMSELKLLLGPFSSRAGLACSLL